MTRFKFRLETLLKLREQHRDQCRSRLEQAQEAVSILEEQANALKEECRQVATGASQAASPGEIDIDTIMGFRRYGLLLEAQIGQLALQRKQVEQEADRRRDELTEADREVKVLEKLREKQEQAFRKQEHYEEVKTLDEIAGRMTSLHGKP